MTVKEKGDGMELRGVKSYTPYIRVKSILHMLLVSTVLFQLSKS